MLQLLLCCRACLKVAVVWDVEFPQPSWPLPAPFGRRWAACPVPHGQACPVPYGLLCPSGLPLHMLHCSSWCLVVKETTGDRIMPLARTLNSMLLTCIFFQISKNINCFFLALTPCVTQLWAGTQAEAAWWRHWCGAQSREKKCPKRCFRVPLLREMLKVQLFSTCKMLLVLVRFTVVFWGGTGTAEALVALVTGAVCKGR